MTDIILVLDLAPGVELRLPARVEAKHYTLQEAADEALATLANKLKLRASHWEDA